MNVIRFYQGIREVGEVRFRSGVLQQQQQLFKLDWFDCISQEAAGPEGLEEIGDEGTLYAPAWERCLSRARALLKLVTEHDHHSRESVERLVALLEAQANSPLRDYWRVRVN